MRDQTERLAALLRTHERGGPEVDWVQFDRFRTRFRLSLNPTGRTPAPVGGATQDADRAVHQVLDAIVNEGKSGASPNTALTDELEEHLATLRKCK